MTGENSSSSRMSRSAVNSDFRVSDVIGLISSEVVENILVRG